MVWSQCGRYMQILLFEDIYIYIYIYIYMGMSVYLPMSVYVRKIYASFEEGSLLLSI